MRDPEHHPFHPKHLISALWALVGGLIVLVATEWYHRREGPQQVIVTNQDTTRRVVYVGDTMSRIYLPKLLKELQQLRRAQTRTGIPSAGAPMLGPDTTATANPIRLEGFKFPPGVKGSLVQDLSTWGSGTCPASTVAPAGDLIFTAKLRSAADTARLSPLNVTITRPIDAKGGYRISDAWYELRPRNLVVVPAPSAPGIYTLEYGVYARAQVNTTYPPFYRRACPITVR